MLGTVAHKQQSKGGALKGLSSSSGIWVLMCPRAESAVGILFSEQLLKDAYSRRTGFAVLCPFPEEPISRWLVWV